MPETDSITALQPFYLWEAEYSMPQTEEVCTGVPLDSIFKPYTPHDLVFRQSMFSPSALVPEHSAPVERADSAQPAWIFVLVVSLVALVLLYYRTRNLKMRGLLVSLVDRRAMDRMVRDNNLGPDRLMPVGVLLSAIAAMTLCQAALPQAGFWGWLLLSAGLSAAYFTRWGLIRLLGNVFDSREAVSTYIVSNYMYHLALATAALPLLLLMAYLPWGNKAALIAIICLAVICFLMRIVRGMNLFLIFAKSSSFYLFYYLCIAEIAPVLVLFKWF